MRHRAGRRDRAESRDDPVDFGLGDGTGVSGTYYTFYYSVHQNHAGQPGAASIMGTMSSYVLIDHYDPTNVVRTKPEQVYRPAPADWSPPAPVT